MREELEVAISSNETRSEIHRVLMSAASKLWVAVWDSCSLQVTLRGSESFELLHAKDCADSMSDQITPRGQTVELNSLVVLEHEAAGLSPFAYSARIMECCVVP